MTKPMPLSGVCKRDARTGRALDARVGRKGKSGRTFRFQDVVWMNKSQLIAEFNWQRDASIGSDAARADYGAFWLHELALQCPKLPDGFGRFVVETDSIGNRHLVPLDQAGDQMAFTGGDVRHIGHAELVDVHFDAPMTAADRARVAASKTTAAMRAEVEAQALAVRVAARQFDAVNWHVGHGEQAFAQLKAAFLASKQLTAADVAVERAADGNACSVRRQLVDRALAVEWQQYHADNVDLQMEPAVSNLAGAAAVKAAVRAAAQAAMA